MTSEITIISKFIHKSDQSLFEYSIPNDTLSSHLLSPIIESSPEILPPSPPSINQTDLKILQKSSDIALINNRSTNDELNKILLEKFYQYTRNFSNIQNYLNKLNEHFKQLSIIINYLRNDKNLINIIELFETRLIQMRVKRNHIDYLLNQSSITNLIQQITPFILKSKLILDYNKFLTSIQLSMNQKTILIDHIKNEYRYIKYDINEYSSKLKQRHNLLIKLTNYIEKFLTQHDKKMNQTNHISIINEYNRQYIELNNLSNEYEQLQNENYLLTLKAKENIQRFSIFMQSNHH